MQGSPLRIPLRLAQDLRGLQRVLSPADFAMYAVSLCRRLPDVLRARNLGPVDAAMNSEEYVMTVDGARVRFEGRSFGGAREMYARGVYFAEEECSLPRSGSVIDIGANVGLFSTLAACRGLSVLAIEPQPGFRAAFDERMGRNEIPLDRWILENAFVGSGGVLSTQESWNSSSHGGGRDRPPTVSLSALMDKHGINEAAFVKMDIEGAEYALFDEVDWLRRTRKIAMEVHADAGSPSELVRVLRASGFQVRLRDADLRRQRTLVRTGYLYAWRSP